MAEKWIQKAIPESHKGKFGAKAKAAGMSTSAFAHYVLAHPDKFSSTTVKEAQLALRLMAMHKR